MATLWPDILTLSFSVFLGERTSLSWKWNVFSLEMCEGLISELVKTEQGSYQSNCTPSPNQAGQQSADKEPLKTEGTDPERNNPF